MVSVEVLQALANLQRMTGKQYPALRAAMLELPKEAALDLLRLTRDLEDAMRRQERRAALQPWRHF